MPHFILECSVKAFTSVSEDIVIKEIHDTALASNLFSEADIKIRIRSFKSYSVGNTKEDFIHVFGHIMEGRNAKQKADLSKKIVQKLLSLFPMVPHITIHIGEFEKAAYFNRRML